jgi:hypothetical protein
MSEDCFTHDDCMEEDFIWLKNELKTLTKSDRVLMLQEYADQVQSYGVGVKEYQAFVSVFNDLEKEE